MGKNYSVAAVLHAPDGSVLARRETYPGLGLRPTRYLNPGDTFVDVYPLELGVDVSEPIVAQATVNLFDFDSETRAGFPALDASSTRSAACRSRPNGYKMAKAIPPSRQAEGTGPIMIWMAPTIKARKNAY